MVAVFVIFTVRTHKNNAFFCKILKIVNFFIKFAIFCFIYFL